MGYVLSRQVDAVQQGFGRTLARLLQNAAELALRGNGVFLEFKVVGGKVPRTIRAPDVHHVRVFGIDAFGHVLQYNVFAPCQGVDRPVGIVDLGQCRRAVLFRGVGLLIEKELKTGGRLVVIGLPEGTLPNEVLGQRVLRDLRPALQLQHVFLRFPVRRGTVRGYSSLIVYLRNALFVSPVFFPLGVGGNVVKAERIIVVVALHRLVTTFNVAGEGLVLRAKPRRNQEREYEKGQKSVHSKWDSGIRAR